MLDEKLPVGWVVVTTGYAYPNGKGTLVKKGSAQVLIVVSSDPDSEIADPIGMDDEAIPVVVLPFVYTNEDVEEKLRPYDPESAR